MECTHKQGTHTNTHTHTRQNYTAGICIQNSADKSAADSTPTDRTNTPTAALKTTEHKLPLTVPPMAVAPLAVPQLRLPPLTVTHLEVPPLTIPHLEVPPLTVPHLEVPPLTVLSQTGPPLEVPPVLSLTVPTLPLERLAHGKTIAQHKTFTNKTFVGKPNTDQTVLSDINAAEILILIKDINNNLKLDKVFLVNNHIHIHDTGKHI
jgi:hypothetical protein